MGMFDDVNFKTACPDCGSEMSGFQSKDGACEMLVVEPTEVRNFYSSCAKCGTWVEFFRPRPKIQARATPWTEAEVTALGFEKSSRPRARGKA